MRRASSREHAGLPGHVLPDGRLASDADDHTAGRDHNETDAQIV